MTQHSYTYLCDNFDCLWQATSHTLPEVGALYAKEHMADSGHRTYSLYWETEE